MKLIITPDELDKLLAQIDMSGVADPLINLLCKELSLKKSDVKASLRTLIRFINQTNK